MAERVEITDWKSSKAWFEKQERQTQVWFATRCAFRVLPALGTWDGAASSGLSFITCRAMLISAAAATCPAAEMKELSAVADSAAHPRATPAARSDAAAAAADAIIESAHSAATATSGGSAISDIADLAAYSVEYSSADPASVWAATSADANDPENWGKLWHGDPPGEFASKWETLKAQWAADGEHWSFWIEWYEAVRDGKWANWDLIFEIATKVKDEDWDAGPVRVAERIAEIEAVFLVEKLPQVNEIYETEDGLYEVRGVIAETSKLMQSVLNRVSFALDTAVQSNVCELNEMSLACKILREALAVGEGDANAVEQYLRRACCLIKAGIESGKYAEDDEIKFLTEVLDETALQVRADHPEVAKASQKRLEQRLREIDGETRIRTAILIDDLRVGTAQRLNRELNLAAEITRDGSSIEATADAIKESGNTAGRISVLERAKRAEGSGQMAMTKMAIRAQQLADWVLAMISGGG